jgi:cytochrome oxidase assembly protein ShyY1
MYGFLLRPKWIAFHLLVLVSALLMIRLGVWQLDRLEQRKDFNSTVTERIDQPPVPFGELLDEVATDPTSVEWRQVTLSGTWLPDQITWFNRSQEGIAGDNVLTALTDGTSTVIVNRGFVPLGSAQPPVGTDDVEVLGRIRVPQARQLGELTDSTEGPVTEVRRVDLELLDQQIPGDLAAVYVDLIGSVPNVTANDPVPVPPPALDEGPHLSYAVQWFIFAAAVLLGWILAVRRSIASHRKAAAAEAAAASTELTDAAGVPTEADCPPSIDAASTTTTT